MGLVDLAGKYFIVRKPMPNGQIGVSRGKILGQVNELYPIYLANIYPLDARQLTMNAQMIVTLEELSAALLFDDRVLWEEEFRGIAAKLEAAKKEHERAKRRITRQAKMTTARAQPIATDEVVAMAVTPDQMAELLRRLQGQPGPDEDDQ